MPEPSESDQISVLTIEDADDQVEGDRPVQLGFDHVVADAERLGDDQAADADDDAADRRPPHPVDRQPLEGVLGEVDERRREQRQQAGGRPGDDAEPVDGGVEVEGPGGAGKTAPLPSIGTRNT